MDIVADLALKMPRVDREYLALGLSRDKRGRTRAMAQGLRKHELDDILKGVKSFEQEQNVTFERGQKMIHFVVVTEIIQMLLESDTKTIGKITQNMREYDEDLKKGHWRKPTILFEFSGRKPVQLFESQLIELRRHSRDLDILQSSNGYIIYLLNGFKDLDLIEALSKRNLYSKRIAEERKYDIECLQRNIQSLLNLV